MERWVACPAAPRLSEGIPSVQSPAAAEGTRAHEYAEKFLRGALPASEYHKLEPELQASLMLYFTTIDEDSRRGDTLLVEHHFDLKDLHPDLAGTADAVLWTPSSRTLRVYDFKYGKGHHVNVEGNYQLQYYALGAVHTLGYPALQIEVVVVQPRCPSASGKVRRWMFDAMDILEFQAFLLESAAKTEDPDAPAVEGRHCFFCPARTNGCPTHAARQLEKAKNVFANVTTDEDDPFAGL